MKYEEAYIQSKDIDWFCIIGGVYCHIASAGGALPDVINDRDKLRDIQKRVFETQDRFHDEEIIINHDFLHQRFGLIGNNSDEIDAYLDSFISMARKGFCSIDRTNVMDTTDNIYHIVCYPSRHVDLPEFNDLYKIEDKFIRYDYPNNIDIFSFFDR